MNSVWWGQESIERALPGAANPPLVQQGGRLFIRRNVAARVESFTPEWTNIHDGDAGFALLKLHAEVAEPVVQRLNRLPEKSLIEFLRIAAVTPTPARPARAMLVFTVSDAAPRSVLIPAGFQVSASAADGSGGPVIFETDRSLFAAPGKIEKCFVQEGARSFEVDLGGSDPNTAVPIFGARPKAGSGILLGLNAGIEPQPTISIGFQLSAVSGAPPPVASGGLEPLAELPRPLLRWEFLDGTKFETAEIIVDETKNLQQSGVVELRSPKRWRVSTPQGAAAQKPLRWVRLRVVFGEFVAPPLVAFVRLNLVGAVAARTIRNEVLEFIPDTEGRRLRLSQKPVLEHSLQLTVNEGEISSAAPPDGVTPGEPALWTEVENLQAYGGEARVYQLDPVAGEVQFGDGKHGASLPKGFRHVVAKSYQVATGKAGAVAADQISSLVSSAPFLVGVTNPLAASGGRDQEDRSETLLRGPEQIRARGRAVTVADYALFALQVSGADVRRSYAVAGMHAGMNDARMPGVVSVFLVGPPRPEGPPYPDQGSLAAVSRYLSERIAPAGVEVVAAAPRFHRVGVRASLTIAAGADDGSVIRQFLAELDAYFDPIQGGEQGRGWPFGGTVFHSNLIRRLLSRVENLRAVSGLNLVVDGQTLAACADFVPELHQLLWPDIHELLVQEETLS